MDAVNALSQSWRLHTEVHPTGWAPCGILAALGPSHRLPALELPSSWSWQWALSLVAGWNGAAQSGLEDLKGSVRHTLDMSLSAAALESERPFCCMCIWFLSPPHSPVCVGKMLLFFIQQKYKEEQRRDEQQSLTWGAHAVMRS